MANTKKEKPSAKVVFQKFETLAGGTALNFNIDTKYYRPDFFKSDGAKDVNATVSKSIKITKEVLTLIESGKIGNLKISYDVYE